jgi:Flp pilus assembly protein TadG
MTQRRNSRRSGAVAPLVAILMVVLCVVISIVLEEGMMLSESRRAQAAADAAAMAGACVLYQNYKTTAGVDSASITAATQMANDNGYLNDASGSSPNPGTTLVVANNPPSTGFFKGQAGYIEVNTTFYQGRYFSWVLSLWPINATLGNTMPVTARAVAEGMWVPFHAGVLLLNYTGTDLQDVGNATLQVNGGDFILDSNSSSALFQTGNATVVVNSGTIDITGNDVSAQNNTGTLGSGSSIQTPNGSSDVYINQHPTPDPLAYLPQPGSSTPGAPGIPPKAPKPQQVTLPSGQVAWLMWPGSYNTNTGNDTSLPPAGNGELIVMMQANNSQQGSTSGIYYIQNGGFSYNNTSIVTDNPLDIINTNGPKPVSWIGTTDYQGSTGGMMIYMGPNATGGVNLQGNPSGLVYLLPMTDPSPYSGMVYWQDPTNTSTAQIAGNGSFTIQGTFYAPTALLKVTGNGGTYTGSLGQQIAGSAIGSQYVSADMKVGGNGNVIVNYQGPPKQPIRILTLVE